MNKNILIILIMASFFGFSGQVSAQTTPTDDDYRNLGQTRENLIRVKREMDRFMKDLAGSYADSGMSGFGQDVKVDVSETPKEVIVKADLPGMSKDKIEVTLEGGRMLKISGSREVMTEKTAPGMVKQERMSGNFSRTLELPADCQASGISASYKEGVLEVTLPKKQVSKEDTIKVKVQ